MRTTTKLALLTVLALAWSGLTAGAASAVEVITEDDSEHCPAVTMFSHGAGLGGCPLTIFSNVPVELGSPLGMIMCNHEFEARIDESGAGFIYSKALSACTPASVVPCAEGGFQDVWPIRLTSTTNMEASFCVVVGGAVTSNCHLRSVLVYQLVHSFLNFTTNGHQACEQAGVSVDGSWLSVVDATHRDIEVLP